LDQETQLWAKLHEIFYNISSSPTKRAVEREFINLRAKQVPQNAALEAALISNGIFVPGKQSDWYKMDDGAKEYDDILADQAAFEALKED